MAGGCWRIDRVIHGVPVESEVLANEVEEQLPPLRDRREVLVDGSGVGPESLFEAKREQARYTAPSSKPRMSLFSSRNG